MNTYIVIVSSLTLLQIQRNPQHFKNYQIVGNTYWHKALGTFVVYLPLSYLPKPPWCRLSAIRCIVGLSCFFSTNRFLSYLEIFILSF